jgi:PIN domain nuclease of toxin-antitoxin system
VLNLDTHVLVFALAGSLTPREAGLLSANRWSISAIVLWEICKLVQLGRIELPLDDREVIRVLSTLHVWPIDLEICRTSTRLDFRGDPADEIIVATSIVHDLPLLTRDPQIRRSKRVTLA